MSLVSQFVTILQEYPAYVHVTGFTELPDATVAHAWLQEPADPAAAESPRPVQPTGDCVIL